MPQYVIKNLDTRRYVTRPGSEHSYTSNILFARIFSSYSAAEADCCGNEKVTTVEHEMVTQGS